MVKTRARARRETQVEIAAANIWEDHSEGSLWWFATVVGLNAVGFIPGTDLGEETLSRAEYESFWGVKNYNNGTRYKRVVSPRMVRRIRGLYQMVFQRPIGITDALPYHFARGLLAERKGVQVNWAAYARKMTHRGTGDTAHLPRKSNVGAAQPKRLCRGGKEFKFMSMEALRSVTPLEKWPKNEVKYETD